MYPSKGGFCNWSIDRNFASVKGMSYPLVSVPEPVPVWIRTSGSHPDTSLGKGLCSEFLPINLREFPSAGFPNALVHIIPAHRRTTKSPETTRDEAKRLIEFACEMMYNQSVRVKWISVLFLLALPALTGISPSGIRFWGFSPSGLHPISVILRSSPVDPPKEADLDGDGSPETVSLAGTRAVIASGGNPVWISPQAWQVRSASLADLNHDRRWEVALLVWRPFQPWPVDRFLPYGGRINGFHNVAGQSCHLILIGWAGKAYREVWAGSALAQPLLSVSAADLDGDGWQELIALESDYHATPHEPASALTVWEWNGFGFDLLNRQAGPFRSVELRSSPAGPSFILTQN